MDVRGSLAVSAQEGAGVMRGSALAAITAMLAAVILLFANPAGAAAVDGISLSIDGRSWNATLPSPLFDEQVRWVPGDMRVARVLVRNDSASSARLQIDLVSGTVDELLRIGDLEVATRIDGGDWTSTSLAGVQELSSADIAGGGIRTVEVRVALPWSSTDITQNLRVDFDLRVTLAGTTPDDPRALSATGGTLDSALLSAAGIGIVSGCLLLTARSRRTPAAERRRHG
jgi:hypothetical protein